MGVFSAPISEQIWDLKYRLKSIDGTVLDGTIEDTWRRVARALAAVENRPQRASWERRFYATLEGFRFLPAGRILAGAGTERDVTLFNCFVMGVIPDSLAGIFENLKEAALTMQQGGGIGFDFSTIRPEGARVEGVGSDASGPLSFMDVWDSMCRTIMSAGARRGAMMATMRCDHPDIEAFIEAKRDPGRLRMFNLSVLATDAFMQAVDGDASWDLVFGGRVFGTVRAHDLWDRIMRATYDSAEPGVIFIDRVNRANNLWYAETISATNPCGEEPLPPYGACLLGSINLAALVRRPFDPAAHIDVAELEDLVETAVRMLDNVTDVSRFPLEAQRAEAIGKRRIGLGVTGLADALMMTGLRYGSHEAAAQTGRWLRALAQAAYSASVALAREKGPFPLFDSARYLQAEGIRALPKEVRAGIKSHGIRNSHLTSIAPTGTISLLAGNVSSGIEPVYALSYTRRVAMPDGSRTEEVVVDYAVAEFRRRCGEDAALPAHFVDAQSLDPLDHVAMQAEAQRHVDSAISKTINCPADIAFERFKDVYREAYQQNCKGCTTFRPNGITGSILEVQSDGEKATAIPATEAPGWSGDVIWIAEPMARPETLTGVTYKQRWPANPHAMYITMNDVVVNGRRRPFEIFINSKNMEHYAWTLALTRMISAVFRKGGDVSFVIEELKAVFDPRGGAWIAGRYVPSILAAIGDVIERHLVGIGLIESGSEALGVKATPPSMAVGEPRPAPATCRACGSYRTTRREGCEVCLDCGHSNCA